MYRHAQATPCQLGPNNIVTGDIGTLKDSADRIRVWQPSGINSYQMNWFSEDCGRASDVLVGDPDNDGEKEILIFAWTTVKSKGSQETRIFFKTYEQGSTGASSESSPYFLGGPGWDTDGVIADVDSDGKSEVIAITVSRLVIYGHASSGYVIEFASPLLTARRQVEGAVGNVDLDPELEIVTTTYDDGKGGTVLVWNRQADGTWTYQEAESVASLSVYKARIGNVDGDATPEIVGVTSNYDTKETYFLVWESTVNGYNLQSVQKSDLDGDATAWGASLGDMNGDSRAELCWEPPEFQGKPWCGPSEGAAGPCCGASTTPP